METTVQALRQAALVVNRSDYERNMNVLEVSAESEDGFDKASALVELARILGMVSIVRGDADTAKRLGADGVLLSGQGAFLTARDLLGEEAIIGIPCGLDRAAAEAALEHGADFVGFGDSGQAVLPPADLIGWWATLTDTPALVEGPVDNDKAGAFVLEGAGFLDCWAYITAHPKGVLQGTVNMLYAIDLALEKVTVN